MKTITITFLLFLQLAAYCQTEECYVIETKQIYHNFDREIHNYPKTYGSQADCQAALSKIKVGRHGSVEVIILKACTPCQSSSSSGENFGNGNYGSGSNKGAGGGHAKVGNRGGQSPTSKAEKPSGNKTNNAVAGDAKKKVANSATEKANIQTEESNSVQNQIPSAKTEEQLARTLVEATPGIKQAISQYKAERQLQEEQQDNYDEKPQGFYSSDYYESDWVTASDDDTAGPTEEYGSLWKEDLKNIWTDAKELFGSTAQTGEILGFDDQAEKLSNVSEKMGYIETVGNLTRFISNPRDFDNNEALIQDAFGYASEYTGAAGMGVGKYSPSVDVYKRSFEGSLNRMSRLITTGNPGDELEVTAPVVDWLSSIVGFGDLGTRELNYRRENHKSFSELKNQYGYVEAAKQKIYNWLRE